MSSGRPKAGHLYDCICPRCGEKHKSQVASEDDGPSVAWTGNGVPRVFCRKCKIITGWYYQDGVPSIDFDTAGMGA